MTNDELKKKITKLTSGEKAMMAELIMGYQMDPEAAYNRVIAEPDTLPTEKVV